MDMVSNQKGERYESIQRITVNNREIVSELA